MMRSRIFSTPSMYATFSASSSDTIRKGTAPAGGAPPSSAPLRGLAVFVNPIPTPPPDVPAAER